MKQRISQSHTRGFSMVEFIVIVTIFGIMASVISFDFQSFKTSIDRSNLASDVGLIYRRMQVYGTSSSNRVIGGPGFDTDASAVASLVDADLIKEESQYAVQYIFERRTFLLYQEIADNAYQYDEGVDIPIDLLELQGENTLLQLCYHPGGEIFTVNEKTGECEGSKGVNEKFFTAVYTRPFPDASFSIPGESPGTPFSVLLVIGTEETPPRERRYLYMDSAGMIQPVEPRWS